ncbi:hypothetical protein Tco_0222182 [Tanacetum coccineum]
MSIYKVPKAVLASMEALRRRFFYGALDNEKKISWIKWSKILSPKKHGGLGVSSLYALNRALLFKWVWRYISQDNSLWARVISSIHGTKIQDHCLSSSSIWNSIVREVRWDKSLRSMFPKIFALDNNKSCSVYVKIFEGLNSSLRRPVRGGVESQQLSLLNDLVSSVSLSNSEDRWVWNLNGSGLFRVCDLSSVGMRTFIQKVEVKVKDLANHEDQKCSLLKNQL